MSCGHFGQNTMRFPYILLSKYQFIITEGIPIHYIIMTTQSGSFRENPVIRDLAFRHLIDSALLHALIEDEIERSQGTSNGEGLPDKIARRFSRCLDLCHDDESMALKLFDPRGEANFVQRVLRRRASYFMERTNGK
jgi:hypothetical protein